MGNRHGHADGVAGMGDTVSTPHFVNTRVQHELQGVVGEQCVGYRDINAGGTNGQSLARGLCNGVAGTHHIVQQHHMSSDHGQVG